MWSIAAATVGPRLKLKPHKSWFEKGLGAVVRVACYEVGGAVRLRRLHARWPARRSQLVRRRQRRASPDAVSPVAFYRIPPFVSQRRRLATETTKGTEIEPQTIHVAYRAASAVRPSPGLRPGKTYVVR